jgi:hypothetical protein
MTKRKNTGASKEENRCEIMSLDEFPIRVTPKIPGNDDPLTHC